MRAEIELLDHDGVLSHWFIVEPTLRSWRTPAPVYALTIASSWGGDRNEAVVYGTPAQLLALADQITGTLEAAGRAACPPRSPTLTRT